MKNILKIIIKTDNNSNFKDKIEKILYIIPYFRIYLSRKSFAQYQHLDGIVIGTTTTLIPTLAYKLAVSGGVQKKYVLPLLELFGLILLNLLTIRPLSELEKFIQINKHLPEFLQHSVTLNV
jgi:hypothetical protein